MSIQTSSAQRPAVVILRHSLAIRRSGRGLWRVVERDTLSSTQGGAVNLTRRGAIGQTIAACAASAGWNARVVLGASAVDEGQQFFLRLVKANDELVGRLLKDAPTERGRTLRAARGGNVAALVASYCSPESSFYKTDTLIPLLERRHRGVRRRRSRPRHNPGGHALRRPMPGSKRLRPRRLCRPDCERRRWRAGTGRRRSHRRGR